MNLFQKGFSILFLLGNNIFAQCPSPTNPTSTITGLHSTNIYATSGSVIYIAPSATVTGNIKLENSSLYNCGTILSPKISMKQTFSNNQYVLENNNVIKSDTISLDSLGHIHNNDTLICKELSLKYSSVFDNHYLIDANNIVVSKGSFLNSEGLTKANYFQLQDLNSQYYSLYGSISARKMFRVGIGSIVNGIIFICADSSFINNGLINNSSALTWSPSIRSMGSSQNTGTIVNIDFCDLSSSNGGMLDSNTGTLSGVTFCSYQQSYCDFSFTSIEKNDFKKNNFLIYPNPLNNELNIILGSQANMADDKILIYNSMGQLIREEEIIFKNNLASLNVSDLPNGIYYLSLMGTNKHFVITK